MVRNLHDIPMHFPVISILLKLNDQHKSKLSTSATVSHCFFLVFAAYRNMKYVIVVITMVVMIMKSISKYPRSSNVFVTDEIRII